MPYIKHKAHHSQPKNLIEYALDRKKNPDLRYATGINCNADSELAYEEFRDVFEDFADEKFYKYSADYSKQKERIRLHHYIQSFDPQDKVTPEEAHRIGLEWAKKVWGENRQIICSTHLDKSHIHNHFVVAPYDLNGKLWHDNMKTLTALRKLSDEISLAHGVSIIENKADRGKKYNEWEKSKQGNSWKDKLRAKIDRLIVSSKNNSIEDLLKDLEDEGYKIRRGKYISVKPPGNERAVRLRRLGDGYDEEQLRYRIANKDKEMSLASIFGKYSGISVEYALTIRQIQMTVYGKTENPKRYNHRNILNGDKLLNFLAEKKIDSVSAFESYISAEASKAQLMNEKVFAEKEKLKSMQKILTDGERLFEIYQNPNLSPDEERAAQKLLYAMDDIPEPSMIADFKEKITAQADKIKTLEAEHKNQTAAVRFAERMLSEYHKNLTDDYSQVYERVKAERSEAEKMREEVLTEQYRYRREETERDGK